MSSKKKLSEEEIFRKVEEINQLHSQMESMQEEMDKLEERRESLKAQEGMVMIMDKLKAFVESGKMDYMTQEEREAFSQKLFKYADMIEAIDK